MQTAQLNYINYIFPVWKSQQNRARQICHIDMSTCPKKGGKYVNIDHIGLPNGL